MISKRLRLLYLISIPLFIVHGTEEYAAGFYNVYPLFSNTVEQFTTIPQGIFLIHQIHWWILLVISYLLLLGGKWQLIVMTLLGFIYIYEIIHIIEAIKLGGYFPGLWTSLLFPFIGFFFWKELVKNWRNYDRS